MTDLPTTTTEILALLREKRFLELIGQFESSSLECKSKPYDFSRDSSKAELAKDVSGFANAGGGLLLLGYKAETKEHYAEDEVVDFRPIPVAKVDIGQIRSILHAWLYPSSSSAEVHLFDAENENCVVAIAVQKAPANEWPILARKPYLDDGTKIETLFGYFERRQSLVDHHPLERIHGLLREGSSNREVMLRLDAIPEMLATSKKAGHNKPTIFGQPSSIEIVQEMGTSSAGKILDKALDASGLSDAPVFALLCVPESPVVLPNLFENRVARVVQEIDHPPELRRGGFDLDLGGNSKIVAGEKRVTSAPNFGVCEVYENGLVLYACRADEDGLAWGRKERQREFLLINQLALVEKILLFAMFIRRPPVFSSGAN